MARRRASIKTLRSLLKKARNERSPIKAIGNLLAAMREADMIRFCGGSHSEEDMTEAFHASELIAEEFMGWARELGVKKSELNELIDGLLDDDERPRRGR